MDLESTHNNENNHNMLSEAAANNGGVTEIRYDENVGGSREIENEQNKSNLNMGGDTAPVTSFESDTSNDNACGGDEGILVGRGQQLEGQNLDALTNLPYEWSPLLEEMVNSIQHMERTYYDGKEFIADPQLYESDYRLYPASSLATHGNNSKSVRLVQMSARPKDDWVNAPVFQPAYISEFGRTKSYAEAVDPYAPRNRTKLEQGVQYCPYVHLDKFEMSVCPYLHGMLCPICLNVVLDYEETEEKRKHLKVCLKEQETKIKISLAIQKSKGITCNICLECVKDKISGEARFGILPNCNHCFCITCIRKWRQVERYSSQVTKSTFYRACPICRIESPFVCPSAFWVETAEEKEALISDYKRALRVKPCRLFNNGEGKCPFGDKCFYMHSLPDGTRASAQLSEPRPVRLNAEGTAPIQEYVLWDYIAVRGNQENYHQTLPAQRHRRYDSSQDSDSSY